jgi:hypothetical protein
MTASLVAVDLSCGRPVATFPIMVARFSICDSPDAHIVSVEEPDRWQKEMRKRVRPLIALLYPVDKLFTN